MSKEQKTDAQKPETQTPDPVDFKRMERNASTAKDTFGSEYDISDVVKMRELVGTEVVIIDYRQLKGENGPYFFVYFFIPGTEVLNGFCCGSEVVMEQLTLAKDTGKLPLRAKIEYPKDKYYKLS